MRQGDDAQGWRPVPVHLVGVHLRLSFRHYMAGMVALALLAMPSIWLVAQVCEMAALSLGWSAGDPAIRRVINLLAIAVILLLLTLVLNVQGRSVMSVVAPQQHLDLGVMARSALTYALAFSPIFIMAVMGGHLTLGDWQSVLMLLPVMLVLVALQATVEEMVCRGYLAQGFQVLFRHAAAAALPVAVIFLALHDTGGLDTSWDRKVNILLISLGLSWLTALSGRLEPAIGVHMAHNIIVMMLAQQPDGDMSSVNGFQSAATDGAFDINSLLAQVLVHATICANYWFIGLRTGFVAGRARNQELELGE